VGGDLRHGLGLTAEPQDRMVLGVQPGLRPRRRADRQRHRDEIELAAGGRRPPARHHVRADDLRVYPVLVGGTVRGAHRSVPVLIRAPEVRYWPTRATIIAIS